MNKTGERIINSRQFEIVRIARSQTRLGIALSEETKAKISAAHKGKVISNETRAKLSSAKKGKPHSETHRQNLAAANRRRADLTRLKNETT
jgi:cyanophycinase-like exopeptidase